MISTEKEEIIGIFYLNNIFLKKIFLYVKPYKQVINKLFQGIVFLNRHNRREINNWIPMEIHHIQKDVTNQYIDREYHLFRMNKIMKSMEKKECTANFK